MLRSNLKLFNFSCYDATLLLFYLTLVFFFCATLVQLFIFPCYGATLLRMHLTVLFLLYYWKGLCFHVFQLFPFFVFKSFLYALISNYFYFIFFSPDPVVRWVKKLYSWSAKNSNDSTFGWRDFGVYLCSIRYPAL